MNENELRRLAIKLNTKYIAAYQQAADALAPDILSRILFDNQVDTESTAFPMLHSLGELEEWEGDRTYQEIASTGYSLTVKPFQKAFRIRGMDLMLKGGLNKYNWGIQDMGRVVKQNAARKAIRLFQAGFTQRCHDDLTYFNAAHPVPGGTQSNFLSAGGGAPTFYVADLSRMPPFIRNYLAPIQPKLDTTNEFNTGGLGYGAAAYEAYGFSAWQYMVASNAAFDTAAYQAARDAVVGMVDHKTGDNMRLQPTHIFFTEANRAAITAEVGLPNGTGGTSNPNNGSIQMIQLPG